jgi:hypothetical protein
MKLLYVFVFMFLTLQLFAQNTYLELPNLIPPAPNAYSLGKYGQIPVGLFTGSVFENVPLFTYKTKNLSIPISLSYNSNGIKVDEISSIIGLGWSLNAGGVITRIVRDEDDFKEQLFFPENDITSGISNNPVALKYFVQAANEGNDSEPDLFLFNFLGYSGQFVYDNNNHSPLIIPAQPLKIENYDEGQLWGFKITTPDGIKYFFLDEEYTKNQILDEEKQNPEQIVETAWYLSKILHPNGDEIKFHYSGMGYFYIAGVTESMNVVPNPVYFATHIQNASRTFSHLEHFNRIIGKKLDSITSNITENGKVVLSYLQNDPDIPYYKHLSQISLINRSGNLIENTKLSYLTTNNSRTFLTGLVFNDTTMKYSFSYYNPSLVPPRLSYSQDHWGYFNGKPNSTLVPLPEGWNPQSYTNAADRSPDTLSSRYGLLEKVTYPTKGFTEIIYEPNSYYGQKTIPGHKGSLLLDAHSRGHGHVSKKDTIVCVENQYIDITVNANQFIDPDSINCQESDSVHNIAELSIFEQNTGSFVNFLKLDPISGAYQQIGSNISFLGVSKCYAQLIKDHTYIITLTAYGCTDANMLIDYFDQPSTISNTNIEVGGQRVKKTVLHGLGPNETEILRYYYNNIDNLNVSSGDQGVYLNYHFGTNSILSSNIQCAYCLVPHDYYSSSSILPLFNSGNSNIYYRYVSISNGGDNFEKGATEHQYIINRDAPGNSIEGSSIASAPWNNTGWDNGLEKQVRYLRKTENNALIPIKKIENFYTTDSSNYQEAYGYTIRKEFDFPCYGDSTYYNCTEEDTHKEYKQWVCVANHKHCYSTTFDRCTSLQNFVPSENHYVAIWRHDCYGHILPYTVIFSDAVSNLDIMSYKIISWWKYKNKSITTEYDLSGHESVVTTDRFYYENKKHMQLTSVETENSKAESVRTKYLYPDDVTSTNSLFGGALQQEEFDAIIALKDDDHYQIAVPIQKELFTNNNRTNTIRYLYRNWNNLILPSKIQSSLSSNVLDDKTIFVQYDATGNLLAVKQENNITVSYIHSYNYSLPIAETKNATTTECGYAGFENQEAPGWESFNSWSFNDDIENVKTGKYSAKVVGGGPSKYFDVKTMAANHSGYKASVWVKGGTDAYLHIQVNDDYTLSKNIHNPDNPPGDWNLLEVELPHVLYENSINASMKIKVYCGSSSKAYFDDLRFYPMDAQMTTYTYEPLIGITSASDANNKPTYYNYDPFNRLSYVKDHQGNILKKYDYHYKTP